MKKDVEENLSKEKIRISKVIEIRKNNYAKWLVPVILWCLL